MVRYPLFPLLTAVLTIGALSVSALAGEDRTGDDRDRTGLHAAVRSGEIMTLSDILSAVESRLDGRVIEIEFERENGVPTYEIYVLRADGRRLEYEIDARTAEILDFEEDD